MTIYRTPDPDPDLPNERDTRIRRVTRVTRGVAAAAVLGTAVFGGLAAATYHGGTQATSTAASSGASTATASVATKASLSAAQAPSASTQTPVASSGGSSIQGSDQGALGQPQGSMLVYATWLYQNGFRYFKMGYASAMAWVLFGATMLCTLVLIKSSERWVHVEDNR